MNHLGKNFFNSSFTCWFKLCSILTRIQLRLPLVQSCAKELEWSLFQNSEETIHSAEKNDTSYKRAGFFTEMKQKKIQNGRLRKFKMAASKKPHFPAPPILNIFSWKFHGLVLGLVGLIDAKDIGVAQSLWLWVQSK